MNALQNMVGGLESVSMERTGNEIKIVISPAAQEAFLDAMSEEKVIAAKHLNEARQRVMNRFELLTGTKPATKTQMATSWFIQSEYPTQPTPSSA